MEAHPGDEIRRFILAHLPDHPLDIAKLTAESFGITRQAVHRHLASLAKGELIEATGKTRTKRYALKIRKTAQTLSLLENRDEDRVWRTWIAPALEGLRDNVMNICHYGFTEMYNNAVDHSEGSNAAVWVERTPISAKLTISDDGVGIFQKIKSRFELEDDRHAILELSKGKLTTDPARHTGEGIFFTSRMFDRFTLGSGGVLLVRGPSMEWLVSSDPIDFAEGKPGTFVQMEIALESTRTTVDVFNLYASPEVDDYGFTKTHVPLSLARYGKDELVSRSQARRALARFDRFKIVVLDFRNIDSIGQAFADEIFRVFALEHPEIEIVAINMGEQVRQMVRRASARASPSGSGESQAPGSSRS